MKNERTYEVIQLGTEFVARVLFNDGYSKPLYIGGWYKTQKAAQKRLDQHIKNLTLPKIKLV